MTVLNGAHLELLEVYADAPLDDPAVRDNVVEGLIELVPHLAETIAYWRDLALERLDGVELASTWPLCRCERDLVCDGCDATPDECDCSSLIDEIAAELEDAAGELSPEDLAAIPADARTLLGLDSGIHCHTYGCPDEREASDG